MLFDKDINLINDTISENIVINNPGYHHEILNPQEYIIYNFLLFYMYIKYNLLF